MKFDHWLCLNEQTCSEDNQFRFKNIELLVDKGGRKKEHILYLDTDMDSFTFSLTNGIYVPPFLLADYGTDFTLKSLMKYLGQFIDPIFDIRDLRVKIKADFNMLEKFNGFKQTQAVLKIKRTLEETMGEVNNN